MKTHKNIILTAMAGISLLATSGTLLAAENSSSSARNEQRATADQHGQLSSKDYKFVKEAAEGGMSEVRLGELARQKGVNPAVKSFGERMVTDHTKANNELRDIAMRKGATLPAEQSHHDRSMTEKLQKANGAEFDKEYADAMVKDHRKDVKEFQDAAQNLQDPDLKAFAQKTLSTLQDHQRLAEQMQSAVKGESSTTTTSGR